MCYLVCSVELMGYSSDAPLQMLSDLSKPTREHLCLFVFAPWNERTLDEALEIVHVLQNSVLILHGDPKDLDIEKISDQETKRLLKTKPIFFLHNTEEKFDLYVLCLKQSLEGPLSLTLLEVHRRHRVISLPGSQKIIGGVCIHPLSGTVNVSHAEFWIHIDRNKDGVLSGPVPDLLRLIAKDYGFTPNFISYPNAVTGFDSEKDRMGGPICSVQGGESEIAIGYWRFMPIRIAEAQPTSFINFDRSVWTSIPPKPLSPITNVKRAFSADVWAGIGATLVALILSFALIFKVYQFKLSNHQLHINDNIPWTDFVIKPVALIVEPDIISWFPKPSAGSLLVALWNVFRLFMVFFFLSNLRTILITKPYEATVKTTRDVINTGRPVLAQAEFGSILDHKKAPRITKDLEDLSKVVHANDGWFSGGRISPSNEIKIMQQGAFYLYTLDSIYLVQMINKTHWGLPNIQHADESIIIYINGWFLRKSTIWFHEFDMKLNWIRDTGLNNKIKFGGLDFVGRQKWRPPPTTNEDPLRIEHILIALILNGIGCGLALLVWIGELIRDRISRMI